MRLSRLLSALLLLGATVALPACVKQQTVLQTTTAPVIDPELIELDAAVAQRFVTADAEGDVVARLRVRVDGDLDLPRPPANVALVIDASASMRGAAIEKTRAAALALVDSLSDGDMLSVVTFGSSAEVIAPASLVNDATKVDIRRRIERIEADGTTDLAGGLSAGIGELSKFRSAHAEQLNRIVLLSDGVPNDASPLDALAGQAAGYGATITALGLGLDFHETLLAKLASDTGGRFVFVEEPAELTAMFRDEMLDLDRVIAQNVSLQLTPGPDVTITEVVGIASTPSGRSTYVPLGNLNEGQEHDVIVRMHVGGHASGSTVELLDASLAFAHGGTSYSRQKFLSTTASSDAAEVAGGINPKVMLAAARATTAAATLRVMQMARSGLLAEAEAELKRVREEADAAVETYDDPELSKLAADLDELQQTLPELAPAPTPAAAPLATPRPTGMEDEARMFAEPPSDAPSMMPRPSPAEKRRRARHNRRAHSRAYDALAPRMAE